MIAAFTLAVLLVAPAGPTPSPAPGLPEIGRVRATLPACAVLNDLVAPSVSAALNADQRFFQTASNFPDYARILDDPFARNSVERSAALSRIDSAVTTMLQDARAIGGALKDPRIAKSVNDPDVQAERALLQQVYAAEMARASALVEFVQHQQIAIQRHTSGFNAAASTPPPVPGLDSDIAAPVFGQPQLQGIEANDRQNMSDWTLSMAVGVRRSEDRATQSIQRVVAACQ
jgi:hypothetical protein